MLAAETMHTPDRTAGLRIPRPVIVVDDSRDDRLMLTRILDSSIPENTPIIELRSGKELMAYLDDLEKREAEGKGYNADFARETPLMIFIDLFMPGMNGVDTLAALRRRQLWADAPVTLITSSCDDISIREAMEAGANAFLSKPFTRFDILNALRHANNFSSASL